MRNKQLAVTRIREWPVALKCTDDYCIGEKRCALGVLGWRDQTSCCKRANEEFGFTGVEILGIAEINDNTDGFAEVIAYIESLPEDGK